MSSSPTAVQFLQDEIRTLRGLISQYEALRARGNPMTADVLRELLAMQEIHGRIEERLLYPRFKDSSEEPLRELGDTARRGQLELREMAGRIQLQHPDKELLEDFLRSASLQLDLDERQVLPAFETCFAEKSAELGPEALAFRAELLESRQFRNAAPGLVQNPDGGEQRRKIV